MAAFMVLLMVVVAVPITALLHAYVLSTLWGWFLVPLGLPLIGLAHAYGISLLVSYLTNHVKPDENPRSPAENVAFLIVVFMSAFVRAAAVIAFGFIAKLLMG